MSAPMTYRDLFLSMDARQLDLPVAVCLWDGSSGDAAICSARAVARLSFVVGREVAGIAPGHIAIVIDPASESALHVSAQTLD